MVLLGLASGALVGCTPSQPTRSGSVSPPSPSADTPPPSPLGDPSWRPGFHYTAASHQINDPNGLFWLDGTYHLFHQYNLDGQVHWGHATSTDLVRWRREQTALSPDEHGQIWSGSAVVDTAGTAGLQQGPTPAVVALFTYSAHGSGEQSQGLAYSTDAGWTWTKSPRNPVLPNPGRRDFRDPKVLWHEPTRRWVMVLSGGSEILFYSSTDLFQWTPVGAFGAGQGAHDGAWECPDLFELPVAGENDTRWVLSVSTISGAPAGGSGMQYFVGGFDGSTFTSLPDEPAPVSWQNYGPDCYAGVTWGDGPFPDQRRIMIAWTDNWRYRDAVPTAGFNGQLSTLRELTLVRDDSGRLRLRQQPVAEYAALRRDRRELSTGEVAGRLVLADDAGQSLDVVLELEVGEGADAGVEVLAGPLHRVRVGFDAARGVLYLDRSAAGRVPDRDGTSLGAEWATRYEVPHQIAGSRVLVLRVLVDRSSVDVYADGDLRLTALALPDPSDTCLAAYSEGGPSRIRSGTAFVMGSMW